MLIMLKKLRSYSLFFLFFIFATGTAFGQPCNIETEWTFNPPVPPSGAYEAGTVVTLCAEVTSYSAGGANWLSGMSIVFPGAWDVSSITNITAPTGCGAGEWLFLETLDCGGLSISNPGFYYDSNVNGPQDGNPCNNWGDGSFPCGGWSFCFDITLDANCGGPPGTPFDGTDITPAIQAYSDSEVGSWTGNLGCASSNFVDGPDITIELDCCDAESGEEPAGPVNICGTTPFNLLTLLGPPIDPNGTWTGPAGWSLTGGVPIFTPSTNPALSDPPGDYTYTVTGTGGCTKSSTITMQFIDLGLQATNSFCGDSLESISGLWNNPTISLVAGGTWTFPDGTVVPAGEVNPLIDPSGIYTYNFLDGNDCFSTISMQLNISPGGGVDFPPNTISVCVLDDLFTPFDSLLGTPASLGGSWIYYDVNDALLLFSGPGTATSWTLNPFDYNGGASMEDGYVVYFSNDPACGFAQDTIFIDVGEVFDPGEFTTTSICEGDAPVVLETLLLGATITPGGFWEDVNGNPVSNLFDPALVAPDSIYTLIYSGGFGGTSCFNSQVMLLTVLSDDVDAGDPTTITVCETQDFFSMTLTLDGDPQPGGVWTNPNNIEVGEFFVPGISLPGDYTYTLNSSCGSDSTDLTVNVITSGDAGIDGILDICPSEVGVPLSDGLGGTPQGGGVWSLNGVNIVSGTVDGSAVTDGDVYQYSVGTGTCADFSEVTINLQPAPFAGVLNPNTQAFCATDGSFSLNTFFTTPPSVSGEFWTGPSGAPVSSTLDPATASTGVYTYTVTNGCGSDDVTILISIESVPNAGTSGPLVVCDNATGTFDLFASLGTGITPGGTWAGPSGAATSTFTIGDPAGAYTYTVESLPSNLCSASATVTVSYIATDNAGLDNTITVCATDPPFDMFPFLNGTPDAGGTWSPVGPLFNPALSTPGDYTYTFANPGCLASSAILTVNVQSLPDVGQNTSVTLCESLGTVDLNTELDGTPALGGIWTNAATGLPVSNPYSLAGACGTSVSLEYTVDNSGCSASSTLDIAIQCPPDAGPSVATTQCADNTAFDLFTILDPSADTPGSFTNTATSISVPNGIVTLSSAAQGSYTYTVDGGECADATALYTLNLDSPINVDIDPQCTPDQTQYVVTLTITGGDGNYTITDLPGGPLVGSTYVSDPIAVGSFYSFTVEDSGPCAAVVQVPTAGPNCACNASAQFVDNALTICEGGTADLELNFPSGSPTYTIDYTDGTNTFTDVGPFVSGDIIQVSPSATTTYTLTEVTDQNCTTSTSDVITVTVEPAANAGPNVSEEFCTTNATYNLTNLVVGGTTSGPGNFFTSTGAQVLGNTITLNSAATDIYTFEVTGSACPPDEALYTITVNDPIVISNIEVDCNPAQTGYFVSFDIEGGDENYSVLADGPYDGSLTPGTIVSYVSALIPNDTDYSFTISDGSACGDQVVSGIDPDCDCPAAGFITGTTAVCTDGCATLTFNLQGDGPWDVVYENSTNPASPISLSGISSGHVVTVCPSVTTTYTMLSVNDANCSGNVTGTPATVTVDPPLGITGLTETCDAINENYTVSFTVTGGIPGTYLVNPAGQSFVGGVYTSQSIPSGTAYSFTVSDAGACPSITIEGQYQCACVTEAGSIAPGLIEICEDEDLVVPFNADEFLDGNDGYQFILHDGDETNIGAEIGRFGTTTIPVPENVNFGQTYYITGVAGNTDGFGNVILNGNCTDQTNGIPVIFHGLPSAAISGFGTVCAGEEVDITVSLSGVGPWVFEYAIDSDVQTPVSTSESEYVFSTTAVGNYTLVSVSDVNCSGPISGLVQVSNFATPTALISGNGEVCENSGDGPTVNLTGQAPWTFFYSINGVESAEPITTFNDQWTIPAEEDGLYALTSLSDANCTGTVSGNLEVTILTAPTALITGGGTVCEGDELSFDVELTGDGPWTVIYTIDGIPQPPVNSAVDAFSFSSGENGAYVITQVLDQTCEGEGLPSDAALIVNPLPTAEILSNQDQICIGQELELVYDLQGNPPFTITYILDDDTISLSGLTSDHMEVMQPIVPVYTEVLYVEDSSNPVCTNTPNNSKFIPVGELPDAPILENDTICSDAGSVSIGVPAVPGLDYTWSPEARLSDPKDSDPTFTLGENDLVPVIRNYTYVLTADNGECSADDTLTITVDPGPRARFVYSPNPVNSEDTKVRFENRTSSSGDPVFFWQFDSLDTSQEVHPTYEFPSGVLANYTVILTAIDQNTGCIDEWSDIVIVKPEMLVYVPSAFTPDNDGLNDLWRPILTNIDETDYRLSVFDRYGIVVFETRDPGKAWNGSMNGDDYYVKTGVYVWQIETKNPLSLEDVDFKGTVTVIR